MRVHQVHRARQRRSRRSASQSPPESSPDWWLKASGLDAYVDIDFVNNRYRFNGTNYATHAAFLTAIGGTFTRATDARYWDSSAVQQVASSGVLRLDHDPTTGVPLGFLSEDERTNLSLRSEEFDNAAWGQNGLTVTANQAVAPDGLTTMDELADTAVNTTHRITQASAPTVNDGVVVTSSFYLKNNDRRYAGIAITDIVANNYAVKFDLQAGTVLGNWTGFGSYSAPVDSGIEDVGGGVYRCWVTADLDPGIVAANGTVFLSDTANLASLHTYTGNGSSIYAWGGQFEEGDSVSSYIKTTTTAVTRNADEYEVTTGATPFVGFNTSAGTVIDQTIFVAENTDNNFVWAIDDGTINERFLRFRSDSTSNDLFLVSDGGSTLVNMGDAQIIGASFKKGSSWALNNFATSFNGAAVQEDNAGTIPTVTTLRIGSRYSGGYLNGHVQRWTYFDTNISDADLEVLST